MATPQVEETATAPEAAPAPAKSTALPEEEEASASAASEALDDDPMDDYDDYDLPPLRMHATRGKESLRLSAASLQIPPNLQQQMQSSLTKRNSFDSNKAATFPSQSSSATSSTVSLFHSTTTSAGGRRSRSRSPSLRDGRQGGIDHSSSFSSLEEFVDSDILYDKMGFVELDLEKQRQQQQQAHNSKNLTPVSERLSEDTLEDVHAFSDLSVTRPSSSVGGSSTVGGGSTVGGEVSSHVLDPLYEGDEDLIDSDGEDDVPENMEQVILTNMERISLQEKKEAASGNKGGDSPSLPTA